MNIETERLTLRRWRLSDAADLYRYASDVRVGTIAGLPPHQNVDESKSVIQNIFSQDGVFAVTLKGDDRAIGCAGLITGNASNFPLPDDEGEISYWIGVPFWGHGYIPEAVNALIDYGFNKLRLNSLWCGYFDGNEQSKRVQEKCGFRYHHTAEEQYYPLTKDRRVEHISLLKRHEWELKNEGTAF